VSTATSYQVFWLPSGSGSQQVQNSSATSYTATVGASGTYEYVVLACNAGGCGPESAPVTETVVFPPASAPTLTVSQPSLYSDTVDFSWTSVATATAYQLEYSKDQSTWTQIVDINELSTTYAPGTGLFYFEVRACNAGGCGPWSAVKSLTVVDK